MALLCGCVTVPDVPVLPVEPIVVDDSSYFDRKGCLIPEIMEQYVDEMPCLDRNYDGCVTRKNWDAFMERWRTATPVPGTPLCQQI